MSSVRIKPTTSDDPDFAAMMARLDAFLAVLNGEQHGFYNQFNQPIAPLDAVVAYLDSEPVGCGAIRPIDERVVEIKRMFVLPESRGLGIGKAILGALEALAVTNGYATGRLETSKRLNSAVGLYQSCGYSIIPNYGPYVDVEDSVCMEKALTG